MIIRGSRGAPTFFPGGRGVQLFLGGGGGVQLLIPYYHTGQCKRTGGCYNELVVAFYSTGGGVKG